MERRQANRPCLQSEWNRSNVSPSSQTNSRTWQVTLKFDTAMFEDDVRRIVERALALSERYETVQNLGVITPLSETDGGPIARRRHDPGRACRSRPRFGP